jgi:hypothetical protein
METEKNEVMLNLTTACVCGRQQSGSDLMLRQRKIKNEEKYEKKIYCRYRYSGVDFSDRGFG